MAIDRGIPGGVFAVLIVLIVLAFVCDDPARAHGVPTEPPAPEEPAPEPTDEANPRDASPPQEPAAPAPPVIIGVEVIGG